MNPPLTKGQGTTFDILQSLQYYSAPLAMTNPVTPAAPFCLSVFAQASKVAPVVYISSNPTTYLIQCNDSPDFAHPRVQNRIVSSFTKTFRMSK
jgi:hypothetical protein